MRVEISGYIVPTKLSVFHKIILTNAKGLETFASPKPVIKLRLSQYHMLLKIYVTLIIQYLKRTHPGPFCKT